MKTALIILGIIAVFCLLLCVRLKITVTWANELFIRPAFGFISYEFSVKKLMERISSLEVTEKNKKKPKKKKKRKKEKEPLQKPTNEQIFTMLRDGISLIRDLLVRGYKHFARKIRVEKYVLKVSVGTDDPSQTAVSYGALSGLMASLTQGVLMYKHKRNAEIYSECVPNFLTGETDVYVDIGLSIMLWNVVITAVAVLVRILKTAIKYGIGYIKHRKKEKAEINTTNTV